MWGNLKSWIWRALKERSFQNMGAAPTQGRYLIAGDSHAVGLASHWPGQEISNVPIINAGVAGHNTTEYCAYLETDPLRGTALSATVLWIGTNDARDDEHRTTASTCLQNTKKILRALKTSTPQVFMLLPPNLESRHSPFNTGSIEYLANTIVPSLTQAADEEAVEILSLDPISPGSDGVHATDADYTSFAKLVLSELEKRMRS